MLVVGGRLRTDIQQEYVVLMPSVVFWTGILDLSELTCISGGDGTAGIALRCDPDWHCMY